MYDLDDTLYESKIYEPKIETEVTQIKRAVTRLLNSLAAQANKPIDVYGAFLYAGIKYGLDTAGYKDTNCMFYTILEHQVRERERRDCYDGLPF